MKERTFILVKPDGVQRGLIGEIIKRFENTGLKIVALKMVCGSKEQAQKHYKDDETWLKSVGEKTIKSAEARGIKISRTAVEQGRWVRELLIQYISMSPSVAMVIEGAGAVEKVRKICGSTSPHDAAPGTIRGDFSHDTYLLGDALSRPVQNLIHASESVEEAEREIQVWFKEEDIHTFKRVDEDLFYRSWR